MSTTLFISQVVEIDAQYGKCYQVADPTSEKISDLVPTDGLVLRIPEAGTIHKMIPYSNSLIIYAANGVWELGPGSSGYFSATSYSIRKISDVKVVNGQAVVDAEGIPVFWASSGVFAIIQDTNTGFLTVRSISQGVIDVFFSNIGETARRTATADFDPVNKRIIWIYTKDNESHALLYDMKFQAFTPWRFEVPVRDIFTTTDRSNESTLRFIVYDGTDGHAICTATDTSFEDLGVATEAYIVTGFDTAQNPAKRKQAPVITVFMKQPPAAEPSPFLFFLTSRPYPIEDRGVLFSYGHLVREYPTLNGPIEAVTSSGAVIGGNFDSALEFYNNYPPEALDSFGSVIEGELRDVLLEYEEYPPEALDSTGSVISGELTEVLITYSNYPPEALDSTGSVISGTLS